MLSWKRFCKYGKYLHTCDINLTKDEKHSRKVQNTEQKKKTKQQSITMYKNYKTAQNHVQILFYLI